MWPRSVKKGEVKQKKERGGGEQNKEEEEREVWKSVWSVFSAISDSLLQWKLHDSCNNNMLCEDLACCRELFQQLARSTVPRGNEIIMITMVQILQGILNILIAILKNYHNNRPLYSSQSMLQRQVGPCATTPSSTCLSWHVHSNDTDTHNNSVVVTHTTTLAPVCGQGFFSEQSWTPEAFELLAHSHSSTTSTFVLKSFFWDAWWCFERMDVLKYLHCAPEYIRFWRQAQLLQLISQQPYMLQQNRYHHSVQLKMASLLIWIV